MSDSTPQPARVARPGGGRKEFRLGVLMVHGIGTQPPRDTLVRWGDVLLKLISRATKHKVKLTVGRASPGEGSGEKPAEVAVDFRADGYEERWLLAEGWWADSFPAPTYSELVSWSVRAVPWSIAVHIAQRYWQANPQASGKAKLIACGKAVIQLLVALALSPVFISVLALTLLLGLLPIAQLRSVILSAQSTITHTVGDSLAFVESPLRAALIRSRILAGLERLQARCERTVILAHSQGAAAALDALGGISQAADSEVATRLEPSRADPVPDTLVTFGSGINQLVSLKVMAAGLSEKVGWNPVSFAVAALSLTVGSLLFLMFNLRTGRVTVQGLFQAAGLISVAMCGLLVLLWTARRLTDKLATKGEPRRQRAGKRDVWPLIVLTLVGIGGIVVYARLYQIPFAPLNFLLLVLLLLAVSLSRILSSEMAAVVTAPVRKPSGLARWVDLYASEDPVPHGPTRLANAGMLESVRVWNRGSILSDHTTYWDNLDGFVLRVVRVCAETAESTWRTALPPVVGLADLRAFWRVRLLRVARRLTGLFWMFLFVLIWDRHGWRVPLPLELPSWSPVGTWRAEQFFVLLVLVAVAAWIWNAILRWSWACWVRAEQEQALAHAPVVGTPWYPLLFIGMVVGSLGSLAGAFAQWDTSMASILLADPATGLIIVLGPAWVLVALVSWLMPAPQTADTTDIRSRGPSS